MYRYQRQIGEVHGELRDAIFFDEPADSFPFAGLQGIGGADGARPGRRARWCPWQGQGQGPFTLDSSLLAHVECDGVSVGATRRSGVEVDLVCDESFARPNGRRAGVRLVLCGSKVGLPFIGIDPRL